MIRTFKITDIDWDLDGERTYIPPTEVEMSMKIDQNASSFDIEDRISDWLSDEFGWCHSGFNYIEII